MSNSMTYRDALEFASRILPNQQIADGERYEIAKQELVTPLFDYADSIWMSMTLAFLPLNRLN